MQARCLSDGPCALRQQQRRGLGGLLLVPSDCVCACACRGYDWASMLIRSRMLVSTRLASSLLDRPSSLGQLPGGLQGGASTAWIVSSITWAGARQLHAFAQALSALNPCRRMAAQVWLHRFERCERSTTQASGRNSATASQRPAASLLGSCQLVGNLVQGGCNGHRSSYAPKDHRLVARLASPSSSGRQARAPRRVASWG